MHVRVNVFSHMLCAISFPHKRKATASWRFIGGSSVLGSVRVSFMVVSYVRGCVCLCYVFQCFSLLMCHVLGLFQCVGLHVSHFLLVFPMFWTPCAVVFGFSNVSVSQKQKTLEKTHKKT